MSFIRLKENRIDAISTDASPLAKIFHYDQICLHPKEHYVQYCDLGVNFENDYTAFIAKCDGTELLDITDKVAIQNLTVEGANHFYFEIASINQNFHTPVILKIKHGVSDLVLYSNRFVVYENSATTHVVYKDYSRPVNLYESIRLNMYYNGSDAESEITEYTTINGTKISGRAIKTQLEKYIFDRIDEHSYSNLNDALIKDIIYFNGNRVTNKQIIQSGDRVGDTNFFSIDFTVPIDKTDTYEDLFQIFPNFEAIDFVPLGLTTTTDELKVTFNKTFTKNSGLAVHLFKGGVLNQTFGISDLVVIDDYFTIDCGTLANDSYYVTVSNGAFTSIHDELSTFLTWNFEIGAGEFDSGDFSNEFLIN